MLTRQHLVIGLSIAGLVLVNLVADVAMFWLMEAPLNRLLNAAMTGVILAQLMLLGLWMGIGDGRWYVRGAIAAALTIAIARSISIAEMLSVNERNSGDPANWSAVVFLLLLTMLVAAILGFLLRRFRNWRLTWQIAVNVSPTTQFQLADVLLWTTLIAAGLAAIRFLVALDEDFSDQFLGIAVIVARSLGTVLTVLVASFAVRQYLRTGIATLVVLLLLGSMLSVTDIYTTFRQVSTGWTMPLSMSQYLILAAKEVLDAEVFVAAAAIQTLLNSLVLRALGCRLVRPVDGPAVPAGELRPA